MARAFGVAILAPDIGRDVAGPKAGGVAVLTPPPTDGAQCHQEAFDTPGSSPRWAISRMQTRQRPNLR
ncbi:hypothetical protein GCM10027615_04890 [Plantactinospora veratri]